ncbi:MAG TPA: alkaline phosphatase family protein [Pyrinomonadaceae bacterium]|nr:alkaline phosphatase family protein [Pyrinomonadaceae bacterium]
MSKTLRDLVVALSLANLCFIGAWRVLVNPLHYTYYHWKYHPGFIEYAALVLDVLLLAAAFWVAATLARRSGSAPALKAARWAFLLALLVPLNDLRMQLTGSNFANTLRSNKALLAVVVAAAVVLAAAAVRWRAHAVGAAVVFVLVLSPFALISLVQGAWLAFKHRPNAALAADAVAGPLPQPGRVAGARVVWIVFDELDQRAAFGARPAGLELPELDRLRRESVFAERALPPSSDTLFSMPSLISGQQIDWAMPLRPNELMVTARENREPVAWGAQPNVFAEARAAGADTAVVGWYHPYCRVIGASLSSCFWEPVVDEISPLRGRPRLGKSMAHWATLTLFRVPGAFRLLEPWYETGRRQDHIAEYGNIMERAREAVKERGFGLTLLHFPIPHHPFIYDRARGSLSARTVNEYADNLALTDRTLGKLRRDMEEAGLWDETVVIVSSDHWWRHPPDRRVDKRVPFIVKLRGQKEGATYAPSFNTVLTRRLILAVLRGEVADAPGLIAWLDRNRTDAEPVTGSVEPNR